MFVNLVSASDRAAAARQLAVAHGWSGVSVEDVLSMPSYAVGSEDDMVDDLRRRRDRYGISYIVVRDRQLPEAIPIVRRLAGT
jgi:hypothetical protein